MILSWDIRKRAIFLAVAPAMMIAVALTLYFVALRYGDVEQELHHHGESMARQLAPAAEFGAFSGNRGELLRLLQAAAQDKDVAAISIHDARGQPLASIGKPAAPRDVTALPEGRVGQAQGDSGGVEIFHAKIRRPVIAFDDPFSLGGNRSEPGDAILGSVTLELSRARLETRKREILLVSLVATLLVLAVGGLVAYRLGQDVTEPVLALQAAVERLRAGNLEARAPRHRSGTLASLEIGFNEMAAALAEAHRRSATALADSEAELAKQLRFAQALLDAQADAGIGLMIIERGRIIFANQAAEGITGYTAAEMKGLPTFIHLVHPDDRTRIMYNHLRRLDGERFANHYDFMLLRKDGSMGYADLAVAAIPAGDHVQILCVVVDVTDRKQAEARLTAAHQELLKKSGETERASKAKSRFLAAASHDLRQPLHALRLFAGELEALAVSPNEHRLVRNIVTATGAMAELLDALLDVSRLDTADIRPQRQTTALAPLLENIVENNRQSAEAKGLRLVCRPTTAWADTDPHLLRRMVGNLVANAIRYTHAGGILVGVRPNGDNWRIEVFDTGIGIDEQHLPHIFQEFYQVANPERDAAKGLGLGLSIVHRLAEILGHELRVRSRLRRGSRFSISLPRAQPAVPQQAPLLPSFEALVVIVSAGGSACDSLCELLRTWGYLPRCVVTAEKLQQALQQAPALILCEADFAGLLGPVLATAATRPAPVIVLGDGTSPGLEADATLPLPVRPARLRALLHHLLDEQVENSPIP